VLICVHTIYENKRFYTYLNTAHAEEEQDYINNLACLIVADLNHFINMIALRDFLVGSDYIILAKSLELLMQFDVKSKI